MNTDSTISLTHVRDRVKAFYDIMDTKKDAYIDLMILDSVREMLSSKYVTQEAFTLDVCDYKAELPCNWKRVIAVIPPCGEGCDQIIYSDFTFDGVQGNCQWQQFSDKFKIMNGYLVFPSNFTYESVDVYLDVYALGEDGFPLLKEAHLPYYTRYANYHVGLKIGDPRYKAFENFSRVRRNLIHNEQADDFQYDRLAVQAVIRQMGLADFRYRGSYRGIINNY